MLIAIHKLVHTQMLFDQSMQPSSICNDAMLQSLDIINDIAKSSERLDFP